MGENVSVGQITQKVREFLFDNYLFGYDQNEFSNEASFLEFGVLDSFGILELIAFIEREFNIEVSDAEILPENMDSVQCVSLFVSSKLG